MKFDELPEFSKDLTALLDIYHKNDKENEDRQRISNNSAFIVAVGASLINE